MAQPATTESTSQPIYSLEEFEKLELPNDDNKYELIDGVLKVAPPRDFSMAKSPQISSGK